MNMEFASAASSSAAGAVNVCSNCHSDDRWILHNVRHRGTYHRLCTSCVLKLHPSSFCPHCFLLFDNPLHPSSSSAHPTTTTNNHLNRGTLLCIKCSSHSHSTCIPPNSPRSPYLCPPCSIPNFKFFDFSSPGSRAHARDVPVSNRPEHQLSLDQRSAKALLAAAKIAAGSMSKAAALARLESERRVKEAAFARKRAKESLERVAMLSRRDADRVGMRREGAGSVQIQGSVPPRAVNDNHNVVSGPSKSRVIARNAPVPMEVEASVSSASVSNKVNIVSGGVSSGTSSGVCGRKGGHCGEENAAVHMDIDATVSLQKSVNYAVDGVSALATADNNVGGKMDLGNEARNCVAHEEKNEAVQMENEDAFAVHKDDHLRRGECLVSGAVRNDAGGTEKGIDVQALVVQMEKNGGIIANGSAAVDGAIFQPKVGQSAGQEQNFDSMKEKDVAS